MITLHLVVYNVNNNFKAEKGGTILVNHANILWAGRKSSNGAEVTTLNFGNTSSLDVWESFEEITMLIKGKK